MSSAYVNLMDVDEFDGRGLYTALMLDYRLRLWAPTSASRAISAVAELLVQLVWIILQTTFLFNVLAFLIKNAF